ncbi:MAG: hypothetical protein ACXAB8_20140 [Promethearchaeota archaeon]|jgi:hypothetical protein
MNYQTIKRLQKDYGFAEMQEMINTGQAWKMEGSVGREAMALLESGACMLPKEFKVDYYGNNIPSRDVLKEGTKGTYKNSKRFWEGVESGMIDLFEDEYEEM